MTDETQLRRLLHAAVPDDASSIDPPTVSTAARKARQRHRLVTLGTVAATVAVVGVVGVVGNAGSDKDRAAEEPTTTAPYDAPACPAALPELTDANTTIDDLDGLTSVRLCPDLTGDSFAAPMTASDERSVLAGLDALVVDLDTFRRALADQREPFPTLCASISVINNRQSLQFTMGERTVLVPTPLCSPIEIEGRQIDGGDLATAFLTALDRQRDELDYGRDYAGPLECGQPDLRTPARPGREQLVAAVHCSASGEATPLDAEQLAALQAAWQHPRPVADDLAGSGENNCTELVEPPATLLASTDRGDVTRLIDSPCGSLVWDSWQPAAGVSIPTTLADLGLRP